MNSDLREGLEKFLAWWLALKTGSQPRDANELRQAFSDELNERTDEFISDQDWDEILADSGDD
ncbi:hypothetical protein [Microcoleus sp. B3-D7]|uniref:hypothetical protein n=1 Tax=Microcoleus sp. B3-D7 TaxID=2818659 RepID=UPI002FD09194